MIRWMLACVVMFGLLMSSAVHGPAQEGGEASPTPSRTVVHYFLPFDADGLKSSLEVTSEERGTCEHTSRESSVRPDAWLCLPGGGVLDPCFERPTDDFDQPATLACAASPFASEVILFQTDEPLPRDTEKTNGEAFPLPEDVAQPDPLPWALVLANGETCEILSGATQVYAGMRVNYGCENQGSVLGEVDKSDAVWAVQYLAPDAVSSELVEVTDAWY